MQKRIDKAFESVFRHTPIGVVLSDLHGTVLDANDAFCSLLGRRREDIVEQEFFELMDGNEAEDARATLGRLRDQEASSVEVVRRWRAAGGRIVTTKVTASVVRTCDGEPIGGIAFVEDIGQRLLMASALADSEARYRRVVEDQTELIVRCLADGTRTFVNQAYCRYAGLPAEQLIGTSFFPLIPEEDREIVTRKYAAMTPENPVHIDEHRAISADGSRRWHRWTDRGIFDERGELVEIQAVGRDITDERASHENYRRLFDAMPVSVWETHYGDLLPELRRRGLDTPAALVNALDERPELFHELMPLVRILTANDAALAMAGASEPAGVLRWIGARYTREAVAAWVRGAAPLLAGHERVADLELSLREPGGEPVDLLQRLARSPNWPDDPRLIVMTLDVTTRKRTERDLLHRQQILEEAEVLARIGSWEWDPSTDRIYGSAGFWRIFTGEARARFATIDEVVGCFRADLRLTVLWNLESLRSLGRRPAGAEGRDMVVVQPDGREVVGRGVANVERNAAGEIVRVYGVVRDLTEQRRLEEAAQREREALTRADKMISLGVLVSGVAHEINNPNYAILLNAALLKKKARDGEEREMIDDIEHSAERIRGIVTELRGFAIDHDPGELAPLSLNDVVRSSLRLLHPHIRKATTRFSTVLANELPPVAGNSRRLEQVLVNLVINACQALESRDRAIVIETGATDAHAYVRVIDEGRGISAADLRKITEPFFTTKRAAGGSGLGLAVSERIAQEHDGFLSFESEPGAGTRAAMFIPCAATR